MEREKRHKMEEIIKKNKLRDFFHATLREENKMETDYTGPLGHIRVFILRWELRLE